MLQWDDILNYANNKNPEPKRRVEKTQNEWRNQLTSEQYYITRDKGTERPFSGEHCQVYQAGLFACVCCQEHLFDSRLKFESGTGWPSFTQPVDETSIQYVADHSHGMQRIEVMCNVCDAHLGHVFPDGPAPSGLRYCINSEALTMVEEK